MKLNAINLINKPVQPKSKINDTKPEISFEGENQMSANQKVAAALVLAMLAGGTYSCSSKADTEKLKNAPVIELTNNEGNLNNCKISLKNKELKINQIYSKDFVIRNKDFNDSIPVLIKGVGREFELTVGDLKYDYTTGGAFEHSILKIGPFTIKNNEHTVYIEQLKDKIVILSPDKYTYVNNYTLKGNVEFYFDGQIKVLDENSSIITN